MGTVPICIARLWDEAIVPALVEYIRIPAKSPHFDADWARNGHIDAAAKGAEKAGTVLLYGHLDKQPEMTGWAEGLGPWTPVIRDGKLYGRGGADDGYAAFASLTAIEAVQRAHGRHARCVVLIECSEESGSPDLPDYVEHLADRIGTPS